MEKIKNIWKRFKGFIIWFFIILGGISAAITIAKVWDEVWQVVTAIWNFLISADGRQMILFLLVVGLAICLVLLNRKVRKLSQTKNVDVKDFMSEYKARIQKKKEIEIKPEYSHILEALGARLDKTLEKETLYGIFVEKYIFDNDKETKLNFNMIIEWLEKNGYINKEQTDDEYGDIYSYYEITTDGFEYLRLAKKRIEEIKEEEKKPL